jgi:hypothetical protein
VGEASSPKTKKVGYLSSKNVKLTYYRSNAKVHALLRTVTRSTTKGEMTSNGDRT